MLNKKAILVCCFCVLSANYSLTNIKIIASLNIIFLVILSQVWKYQQ